MIAEGGQRIVVVDVVGGTHRREPHANALAAPDRGDRLHHLEQQPRAVFDRAAVRVGALVRARTDELVEQIAVGAVDLDAIEAGVERMAGAALVLAHDVGQLLDLQRARRFERHQHPLAELVLDEGLALRPDRRRRDRRHAVGLQRGVRNAADMPQLQEDPAAGLVHGVGHQAPAVDLLPAVDAGRPGVALALHRDLCRLRDDQPGRGALGVVTGVQRRWNVARLTRA